MVCVCGIVHLSKGNFLVATPQRNLILCHLATINYKCSSGGWNLMSPPLQPPPTPEPEFWPHCGMTWLLFIPGDSPVSFLTIPEHRKPVCMDCVPDPVALRLLIALTNKILCEKFESRDLTLSQPYQGCTLLPDFHPASKSEVLS